jgi:phosphoribosylglycinamide formyltransferase-1
MKICVFAYNFPHKKTQEGLYKLFQNDVKISHVILSDFEKLNIPTPKFRVGLKNMLYDDPKEICNRLNLNYSVTPHNSDDCEKFLNNEKFDLGIILGSRILNKKIINKFKIGILNMHPGLLPENRGLDNIKWGIINNIKQGVTTHLINEKIDLGVLVEKKTIDVFTDDTLIDIFLRIQNMELNMMISSIEKIKNEFFIGDNLSGGNYFKSMDNNTEIEMINKFKNYKETYNGY